jgi:hypothetical protein
MMLSHRERATWARATDLEPDLLKVQEAIIDDLARGIGPDDYHAIEWLYVDAKHVAQQLIGAGRDRYVATNVRTQYLSQAARSIKPRPQSAEDDAWLRSLHAHGPIVAYMQALIEHIRYGLHGPRQDGDE